MSSDLLSPEGWSAMLARLPAGLDLAATAEIARALRRARGVPSASALLRLALVYANTPLSLRATAEWAAASGTADVSDVALLYRLEQVGPWLESLLGELIAARLVVRPAQPRAVEAGASLRLASRKRSRYAALWQVTARFDLTGAGTSAVRLSRGAGVRRPRRLRLPAGTVRVAHDVRIVPADVVTVARQAAAIVAPLGMVRCTLLDTQGRPVTLRDIEAVLDLPGGLDMSVSVVPPGRSGAPPVAARLVAADPVRAQPDHGSPDAGRRVLFTTLDPSTSPADVLILDGMRSQLETIIRRLKHHIRLDDLRAKSLKLERTTLLAKLIRAALVDQMLREALTAQPVEGPTAKRDVAASRLAAAG
jgi:hypothetical protein